MIQSVIMPQQLKVSRVRLWYRIQGIAPDKIYYVIGYDMKSLRIVDEKGNKPFIVRWKDVELVKSEYLQKSGIASATLRETQSLKVAISKLESAISRSVRQEKKQVKDKAKH